MNVNGRERELYNIVEQKKIYAVFQPIVSLENGNIYGYEALSRIEPLCTEMNIQQLFEAAADYNYTWELEKLCRKAALKKSIKKPKGKKLFLNVSPSIIQDMNFRKVFSDNVLGKQNLISSEIVFEITENSDVDHIKTFSDSIEYYRKQQIRIAVDDYGAKFSGLNRVCSFHPEFLKIDIELIHNIDTDSIKKSAVKSIVAFCREAGIKTIAEGIETESELRIVMNLGVNYGQGFYLARPETYFAEIDYAIRLQIESIYDGLFPKYTPTLFGRISEICSPTITIMKEISSIEIYNIMLNDHSISEAFVLNKDGSVYGILTRNQVFEAYSGMYGYNLGKRLKVEQIANPNLLCIDGEMSVDMVAEIAMKREISNIYDAIAVTENNQFIGAVTIKDLLLLTVKIQVTRATEANPLTGLPGNNSIHEVIVSAVTKKISWAIIYIDLDNFKAYNDTYGFTNGDIMIRTLADTIMECTTEKDFVGHIGGDDFVVVTETSEIEGMCKEIGNVFSNSILTLYSVEDRNRGCITSLNRSGFIEDFPLATLSISAVTSENNTNIDIEELSHKIAIGKKKSKKIAGNSIIIE